MNYVLIILSCFLIISGFLPLIKHDNWTFRVFEYPRAQKLIISIIILSLWIVKTGLDPEFSNFFLHILVYVRTILTKYDLCLCCFWFFIAWLLPRQFFELSLLRTSILSKFCLKVVLDKMTFLEATSFVMWLHRGCFVVSALMGGL